MRHWFLRLALASAVASAVLFAQTPGRQKRTVSDAEVAHVHKNSQIIDTHNDVTRATVAGMDIGTERHFLQLRAEFFNAANTPTFFLPAASNSALTCIGPAGKACNARNPNFGKLSTGTANGRQIQFGLKYYF
jgi:hypothetical protein